MSRPEHERIWLEPAGAPDRCWCEDNQWGGEGVEYIRRDIHEAALLSAKRVGMETMSPLVERAFRDGLTYGSICDVVDQDEAWRTSSVRQKAQEIGK